KSVWPDAAHRADREGRGEEDRNQSRRDLAEESRGEHRPRLSFFGGSPKAFLVESAVGNPVVQRWPRRAATLALFARGGRLRSVDRKDPLLGNAQVYATRPGELCGLSLPLRARRDRRCLQTAVGGELRATWAPIGRS